jgi:PRTRC genetic system protein B
MGSISILADDVLASLHFLKSNELMLMYRKDEAVHSKLVSIKDARIAFDQHGGDDIGWLPAGVLRTGRNVRGDWAIYVAPPQVIEVCTDQDEKLLVPIPMSLFLGWERRYYIWSLQGKVFQPNQEVFKAPFPNVYDNGRVCWGSHKPRKVTPDNIKTTWSLFFGTVFNNHIAGSKTKSCPHNALDLLRKLAAQKKKTFPATELIWASRSVDACIENLFRYGGE